MPTSSTSSAGARRCRSGSSRMGCPIATRRRRPTPQMPTSGARRMRRSASSTSMSPSRSSTPSWESPSGIPLSTSPPRTSPSPSSRVVRCASTAVSSPRPSISCARPTPLAAGTGSAWQTRSRTASSRPRAAGSTRPPAWPCSSSPTSASSVRSTMRTPSRTITRRDAAWAACSTRVAGSIRRRSCCGSPCRSGWPRPSPER